MSVDSYCKRCGVPQTIDNSYYTSPDKLKFRGKCKECLLEDQREYRKTPEGKAKDQRYERSPKKREVLKRYRSSDKGKAAIKKSCARMWKNNNLTCRARNAVRYALYFGDLTKPDICEFCGNVGWVEGHHWSYCEEFFTDVIWLCTKCHLGVHNKEVRWTN